MDQHISTAEPPAETAARKSKSKKKRVFKAIPVRKGKPYNVAVLRIVDGEGSIYQNLADITGHSIDSLKARVKRARYDYVPDDGLTRLTGQEARYFSHVYANNTDPAVREWLRSINTTNRKKPDCRGSGDSTERDHRPKRCQLPSE